MMRKEFIMLPYDREEKVNRFLNVIEKYKVTSQIECAALYEKEYGVKISQSTVYRYFRYANIKINYATGRYEQKKSTSAVEIPFIHTLLENSSYGRYQSKKNISPIWLDVEPGTERNVARELYDFCNNTATILPGYGCIYIRCLSQKSYDKIVELVDNHKILDKN